MRKDAQDTSQDVQIVEAPDVSTQVTVGSPVRPTSLQVSMTQALESDTDSVSNPAEEGVDMENTVQSSPS